LRINQLAFLSVLCSASEQTRAMDFVNAFK
jgi:hypothetical protein